MPSRADSSGILANLTVRASGGISFQTTAGYTYSNTSTSEICTSLVALLNDRLKRQHVLSDTFITLDR